MRAILPALDSLLSRLNLGYFDSNRIKTYPGRHINWSGATSSGAPIFVKWVADDLPDARIRLKRMISLEKLQNELENPVARPRCLGWDETSRLIVFEQLTPASNGAELADDGRFCDATARTVGKIVADLHNSPDQDRGWIDSSLPRFPPAAELDALPMEAYANACAAELELWRLLHGDQRLTSTLKSLKNQERTVEQRPTHCDLRLDQIVESRGRIHLSDWDEFRLADPARDIGAFIGEWLFRSVLKLTEDAADSAFSDSDIRTRGAAEFAAIRPRVVAFWHEYRAHRPIDDPGFVRRVVSFVGWHQFERLLSSAHGRSRLLPIERAVAGIGRAVLLDPDRFVSTLGLGGTDDG